MSDSLSEVEKRVRSLLDERFDGLTQRIDEWLEESRARGDALQQIVNEALRRPFLRDGEPPNRSASHGEAGLIGDLATFAKEVECSRDQGKILSRLLAGAESLAPRVLLFIVKKDSLRGWAGRGFAANFDARSVVLPLRGENLLARAFSDCQATREMPASRPGNREIARWIGEPREMLAVPLWVHDRVVAILYADTTGAEWFPDALGVMASLSALSLEALPARSRYPRPASASSPSSNETPAPVVVAEAAQPEPPRVERATAAAYPGPVEPEDEGDGIDPVVLDEARRFARLLVSEIVLYNERTIEEGRRAKDLYERLQDDIDRSYRMYEQRMGSKLPGAMEYFREELIRTLAKGDESAITLPWS